MNRPPVRVLLGAIPATATTLLPSCASDGEAPPAAYVYGPPPLLLVECPGPCPYPGWIWIGGGWTWTSNQRVQGR